MQWIGKEWEVLSVRVKPRVVGRGLIGGREQGRERGKEDVHGIGAVGGANDDDLSAIVEPIHEREEGRDDRSVDLVLLAAPYGGQAVDFVEENDGGLASTGLLKEESELAFRFPDPLAEAVSPLAHEERDVLAALGARGGQGTGEEGLPSAGRAGLKEGRKSSVSYVVSGGEDDLGGDKEGQSSQTRTYPKNNTPLGGVTLNLAKYSGYSSGNITISFKAVMCPCKPPTLFQSNDGSTSTGRASARLKSLFP